MCMLPDDFQDGIAIRGGKDLGVQVRIEQCTSYNDAGGRLVKALNVNAPADTTTVEIGLHLGQGAESSIPRPEENSRTWAALTLQPNPVRQRLELLHRGSGPGEVAVFRRAQSPPEVYVQRPPDAHCRYASM
jgi:hypothetical protein